MSTPRHPSRRRTLETALAGIQRAAGTPLDSQRMREEIGAHLATVIPTTMYSLNLLDPEVGLATDYWSHSIPVELQRRYCDAYYPVEEALSTIDDARAGQLVSTRHSPFFFDLFASEGVQQRMRGVFLHRGAFWGYACMVRTRGDPAFTDDEADFMRRIVPHASRGFRRAALADASVNGDDTSDSSDQPGVLVLDARERVVLRSRAAEAVLDDLTDLRWETERLPTAVRSVLLQLEWRQALAERDDSVTPEARLHARGQSGRRYTLYATRSVAGADTPALTTVLLAPQHPAEIGNTLARLYGLSPRERQVLVRIARGESTKEVAAGLGLSAWTVQEHVGNACAKVGVRTRRELLARIFLDTLAAPAAVTPPRPATT